MKKIFNSAELMESIKNWLALGQVKGIGPSHLSVIYNKLKEIKLSLGDIIDLSPEEISSELGFSKNLGELIAGTIQSSAGIEEEYSYVIDNNIEIIPFFSEKYPENLKILQGGSAPPFLFARGNPGLLENNSAAVLGDNKISEKGRKIADESAKILSQNNITVISGFAAGAGIRAHKSALENSGQTIAVIPCGMKFLKPPEEILPFLDPARVLFISQYNPSVKPDIFNAYIRNRMICALSKAVYIVEAPEDGGIYEAAKSAFKINIPIFTTKYRIYPPNAGGNESILNDMGAAGIDGDRDDFNIDSILKIFKGL